MAQVCKSSLCGSAGAVFLLAVSLFVLALCLSAEGAEAWEDVSSNSISGECGHVYKYTSSSSSYTSYSNYETTSPYIGYYGYMSTTYDYTYYYEPWYLFPLDTVDNRTYIDSATLTIQTSGNSLNKYVQASFLSVDPTSSSATAVYNDIRSSSGAVIGTLRITSPGKYTFTFSSTGLASLRDRVRSGDHYAWIGFAMTNEPSPPSSTGSFYYHQYLYANRVTLTMKVDRDAPVVPTLGSLPNWTVGTSVNTNWSAAPDLPAGGNRSGVEYLIRVQLWEDGEWVTHRLSGWSSGTSATFDHLIDGGRYRVQVQSRDASDFRSAWSEAVCTTMDSKPPTTPVLQPLSQYTPGSTLSVRWSASTDAGIGLPTGPPDGYPYELQWSNSSTFAIDWSEVVLGTSLDVSGLENDTRYFYRVRARDAGGQLSEWSPVESTTLDDDPPSVPAVHEEEGYSQGTSNPLAWDASTDAGVGLKDYRVQAATDETFGAEALVLDTFVSTEAFEVTGLTDGVTYHYRVASRDHFDHESAWSRAVSSTQDDSGPSAPVVHQLSPYSRAGTILLTWDSSSDDGAGMGWYRVLVSKDPGFGEVDAVYDIVTGTSWEHVETGSHGQTLFLRVVAVDLVGNEGPPGEASTTMDTVAPEPPVIYPLPPFSPGTELDLSWSPSKDYGSGIHCYLVDVLSEPGRGPIRSLTANTTSMVLSDLDDGVRYWFRVTAVDEAGNANAGQLANTTMDASPPGVPVVDRLPEFLPGPGVTVSWAPVTDASGLQVLYRVSVYDGPGTSEDPVTRSPWLSDTSYEFNGLESDVTLYFRVESRDPFHWTSPSSDPSSTMIDTTGPSGQVIDDLPEYSRGTGLLVTWSAPVDGGVGGVEGRLVVYAEEGLGVPVHVGPWVVDRMATVIGLADGVTHWLVVECRDGFGNVGPGSEPVSTTMDATPPILVVDAPGVFGPRTNAATGTVSDSTSGAASVEASFDGGVTWEATELEDGVWSMAFPSSSWSGGVLLRATDLAGNTMASPVVAEVDQGDPTISIDAPVEGSYVHGPTCILGAVSDPNLESVEVDYRGSAGDRWSPVQPLQCTSGTSGTLATWMTSGLADGDYTIRVKATDALGNSEEAFVSVTLTGADLTLTDIAFSDNDPLPGARVEVRVTVGNSGDGDATGVTVVLSSGDEILGERTDVVVPAHGSYVAVFTVRVEEGETELTARATSPYYDTGPMTPAPLATREEGLLEGTAGTVGVIVVILAVLVLAILLVSRMREGKEGGPALEPPQEVVVLDPLEDTGWTEVGDDTPREGS